MISYVSAGVEDDTVNVDVKFGIPDTEDRLTPVGSPESDKLTVKPLPETSTTETVALVDPPCVMLLDGGLTLIEKSIAITVNE